MMTWAISWNVVFSGLAAMDDYGDAPTTRKALAVAVRHIEGNLGHVE
jgi:hypothetical protein